MHHKENIREVCSWKLNKICLLYAALFWSFLLESQLQQHSNHVFFTVKAPCVLGNTIRHSVANRVKSSVGQLQTCQPRVENIPSSGIS